jgi:hypothetical protein
LTAPEAAPVRSLLARSGGGIFVTALGGLGIALSLPLEMGRLARMGPGFMPLALSGMVTLIGLAIWAADLRAAPEAQKPLRPLWRPLLLVLASVATFGLLIESAGLLAAILASVCIAALAEPGQRPREVLLLVLFLSAFCVALFVGLLGMSIPVV